MSRVPQRRARALLAAVALLLSPLVTQGEARAERVYIRGQPAIAVTLADGYLQVRLVRDFTVGPCTARIAALPDDHRLAGHFLDLVTAALLDPRLFLDLGIDATRCQPQGWLTLESLTLKSP